MMQLKKKDTEETAAAETSAAATPSSPPAASSGGAPPPASSAPPSDHPEPPKMTESEGAEGADDAEMESEPTRLDKIKQMGKEFMLRLAQNRRFRITVIASAGAVVASIVVYQVGYLIYAASLIALAEESMQNRDYAQASAYARQYEDAASRTDQSLRMLARSEMYLGDYESLDGTLAEYDDEDPELLFMQVIARHHDDPNEASSQLAVLDSRYGSDEYPYIAAARGVFAMLENLWNPANELLENVAASEDDFFLNQHLIQIYHLYLDTSGLNLQVDVPVHFSRPRGADDRGLGFVAGTEAFYNIYTVPLSEAYLARDLSARGITGIYLGLRLLAQTQANPENAADIVARFPAGSSALAHYLAGFYFVQNGEYGKAAERYATISELHENTLSTQYEAQARWLAADGEAPDERVKKLLNRAVELGIDPVPFNVSALNNIAYLEYSYGDLATAERLINEGGKVDTTNKFILVNRLLVEAANDQLDYESAQTQVEALLPELPQSETVLRLAVIAETGLGNMQQAINYLYRLREWRADDPEVALQIADRHRYLGNIFLAIQDLQDAQAQFPGNADIAAALALYKTLHGDTAADESIAALPPDSAAAQRARAVQFSQRDEYEQAVEFASAALESASPKYRAEIALDLARMHLGGEDPDKAAKAEDALLIAREAADDSSLFGLHRAIDAVLYRVQAEQNIPNAAESETALAEATAAKDVFAQIDIARALIAQGNPEVGVQALEKIRREQRGNIRTPEFFTALIDGYEAMKRPELAKVAREKFTAILSGDDEEEQSGGASQSSGSVFAGRANALKAINAAIKAKDYAEAIALFTELIESNDAKVEKPALNFQNRGVLHVKLKQYEEAAQDFAKALTMRDQLSPKEADAVHYNYVHALAGIGEYKKLQQEVETRLAEADRSGADFPHRRAYLRLLGAGLASEGRHREAADIYGLLVDRYPREISNYILLSDSERVLENFEDSIAALSKGLEIAPENLKIHERLLKIYRQLGNSDLARQQLKIINSLRRN